MLRYRLTPMGDILVIRAWHSREKYDPRLEYSGYVLHGEEACAVTRWRADR
jgi:hypothetical protein